MLTITTSLTKVAGSSAFYFRLFLRNYTNEGNIRKWEILTTKMAIVEDEGGRGKAKDGLQCAWCVLQHKITPQEDDVEVILSAVKHLLCAKSVLKSRNANPVGIKRRTHHRGVVKSTRVSEGGLKSVRNNWAKTAHLPLMFSGTQHYIILTPFICTLNSYTLLFKV